MPTLLLALATFALAQNQKASPAPFRAPDRSIPIPERADGLALGDLEGDGDLEIVVAGYSARAWQHDGTPLAGFRTPSGGPIVLADLDRDPAGDLEILTVQSSMSVAWVQAHHHVDADGISGTDAVSGWPVSLTASSPIFGASIPAVGDLDQDGDAEVSVSLELYAFPSWNASVHLLAADGSAAGGAWPRTVFGHSFAHTAVAQGDLDGDGALELLYKSIAAPSNPTARYVHAWSASGAEPPGFPAAAPTGNGLPSRSSCVLGDLDGDGRLDLVTGVQGDVVAIASSGLELFRHGLGTGRALTPALGDLDGDGRPELVVAVNNPYKSFYLLVLDHAGNVLARTETFAGSVHPTFSALIADLDGDGAQELLIASQASQPPYRALIHVFARDGRWRPELTMLLPAQPNYAWNREVELGDLDGDGRLEVVAADGTAIHIWNTAGSPADADWPMFMHDAAFTGRFE